MARQAWLGSLVALIAAVLLIIYSRTFSERLYQFFFKPEQNLQVQKFSVATLTDKVGTVFVRHTGENEFSAIKPNTDFFNLEQIKVGRASSASLLFKSDWRLELQENTIATFELYRPGQDNSPALLSIAKGSYSVLQPGKKGMLYIMRDKKVFSPDTDVQPQSRVIELQTSVENIIPDKTSEPESLTDTTPQVSATSPAHSLPSAITPGKLPDKIKMGDEETLSSPYIEEILGAQASAFRKCQLNSLRDNKTSVGSLLLSVTISPAGKVDRVKVLQDQINNSQLVGCATSVIDRVQFKSFDGMPITLTYPLEFK
ncbi:MAG: AgmX/PglI C-terminal domain-containing protein [Bdellovibrionales bacterium]|nr:AgmX/PglI C-terminal domain-containing protein [Bdellovibrionales bacterium]